MSAQPTPPPADNTVGIEIDGVALRAPKGSMIIHAADKAGIAIPRFCYHDKLPIAANCRMCLVDVEKAPKPMPACATPVMDGMRVFTQSKRALDSQRNVMEFLLINHPLDCPICDQGGECELQDVAMGYGRSVSRFVERKRVQADEDMGPLIATDMTRCIHCTRCVRFSTEIAGTFELGGMGRGENLSIGTYIGKTIESELSGNVIDVCPVGALTNKPFRFRARAWELTAREGIGYHDSLGSNLFMHVRRGEVMRCVPRGNEAINESWLSDRDRYSHAGLQAPDRLLVPMVKQQDSWREVSWDAALRQCAEALRAAAGDSAWLVHPSTSCEEGSLLAALAEGLGSEGIDHRLQVQDFADGPIAQAFEASLDDVEAADAVLLIGCHPRWEAPILGHRLRKASKRGARIMAINPVAFDHNLELHVEAVVTPAAMIDTLLALAKGFSGSGQTPPAGLAGRIEASQVSAVTEAMAATLGSAQRPVIMLGELVLEHANGAWLRQLARHIAAGCGARLNQLWSGANAVGLVQCGVVSGRRDVRSMLETPQPLYVLYGVEPEHDFADAALALGAMAKAPQVVAFTAYASEALKAVASVLLPIALPPEFAASYVNAQGQPQSTQVAGKAPGEARPGWRVLRALGEQLGLAGFDFVDQVPLRQRSLAAAEVGLSVLPAPRGGLQRIATTAIYRSDAVVRRAPPLQAHPLTRGPAVILHPADAAALQAQPGDMLQIDDGRGTANLPLRVDARVAAGGAWIERGYDASAPVAPLGAALTLSKA